MRYDFSDCAKAHLKDLVRVDTNSKARAGYLRLDMNESVSGLPKKFVKETIGSIDSDYMARYPGYSNLIIKIARSDRIGPGNICVSNGSDAAIKYIFDAYISPGDKILLTDPAFAMYPVYCDMFQARKKVVSYKDLRFPAREFIAAISKDVKMVVLVNPNNPTGSVAEERAIDDIIKKSARCGALVVIDEAYSCFYPKTVIKKVMERNNLIVLRTFSKAYAVAGLRLGYAAACPGIIKNLKKVKPTYDVNGIAVRFAERLLDNPNIVRNMVRRTAEGKEYLTGKLSGEGMSHIKGHANFVLVKCGERVNEIANRLAKKKILVGYGFKQGCLKDCIRVTAGDMKVMGQFWEVFIKIWKDRR